MKATVHYSNGSSYTITHIVDMVHHFNTDGDKIEAVSFSTCKHIHDGVTERKTIDIEMDNEVLYIVTKNEFGMAYLSGTVSPSGVIPNQVELKRELAQAQERANIEHKRETLTRHVFREMEQEAREEAKEDWLATQSNEVREEVALKSNKRKQDKKRKTFCVEVDSSADVSMIEELVKSKGKKK